MKNRINESELILNPDGSVYHLNLRPEEIADTIIIVGDPGRVPKVSKYFDRIELKKQKREFTTHTGYYNNKRLTVISTGMGTDNIEIFMNELDALVNVDLENRVVKDTHTSLNIIRFGTSGALQADIPLDSYVVSTHGVGLDLILSYYVREETTEEQGMLKEFLAHIGDDATNLRPYITTGSSELIGLFSDSCIAGMTATGAGFFAAQGRVVRAQLAMPDFINKLPTYRYQNHRITNFEMETSAIYGIGREVLGHKCCSVNLIIANRQSQTYSTKAAESMESMIQMGLEKLTSKAADAIKSTTTAETLA